MLFASFTSSLIADEGLTIVAVGQAEKEVEKILLDGPYLLNDLTPKQLLLSRDIKSIIKNDFSFYKKSFFVELKNEQKSKLNESMKYEIEKMAGHKFVIRFQVEAQGNSSINMRLMAWNIEKSEQIFKIDKLISKSNLRSSVHAITDQIYTKITGKESIFTSKIYFVSDKHSSRYNKFQELYSMDYDGNAKVRITFHRGTVISPAISYDRKKVVYSLISHKVTKNRNVNLYIYDFITKKHKLLSSRRGINSGAIFMPNGKEILLTLSFGGNAEIYAMNIVNKSLRRITKNYSLDVDPSINSAGSLLAFLSGRSGRAMIYTMNPKGLEKSVKRISFVGKYNATPRFSPNGEKIVFSSWLDERFDLFRIDANGNSLSRLTKDFGSNEDPTFSNDGEFIAFSSQRILSRTRATHNIYIMDKNGDILGSLTKNFGNCITPRWSKSL